MFERSKPVSHALPEPPASESGRAIISISMFATICVSGNGGWAINQLVPCNPVSSPIVAAKTTVRFGLVPALS